MYKIFDTFLFRTPYFSYSALSDFESKRNEPIFREMLQIATPDLSENMDKGTEKLNHSTCLYYQRACTRPTPFGLFAGCSVGTVGNRTEILLSELKKYKRTTRLDMNYICELTQQIERDRNIREQLHYYTNRSIYPVGNYLRYVEYHYRKTRRMHNIIQIENSEYLQVILSLAKTGLPFSELVQSLVDDEITMEDAIEYIHELIDAQVLVSELEPAVTNVQPLTSLNARLKGLSNLDKGIVETLLEIEKQLVKIDQQPIGTTGSIYPEIIKNIEKTKVKTEIKCLFQTDMFKPTLHATVSRNIIKDIQQSLIVFNKITPTYQPSNLSKFIDNFVKRYDRREMPLLSILDNELGIGYGNNISGDISPLVDDLTIPRGNSSANNSQSPIHSILLQKFHQSTSQLIELTDEDVNGIEPVWDDLPDTMSVMCQILQDDEKGRSIYIKMVAGVSSTLLLGRFCHLDEKILNHTLTIAQKEAQMHPNAILAEIVHLPESRLGNILLRPVLRPYEIPYLAKPGVLREFEISPAELYVSVKNNRVVLHSKQLNKEIIPRMSTAHNYKGQNAMPVYHFLCDMQHQNDRAGLSDNELYIDMNNPLSIRAWLSVVKKHSSFKLEELLFDPETAVVHGPEGVYTNEFIFALYKVSSAKNA